MADFTLTTGSDTIIGTAGNDTINGSAATLNSGDSLTGGAGFDTLVLNGSGYFQVDQLATFAGFESITLNNSTSDWATLYLDNQSIAVTGYGSGEKAVYLGSGAVTFQGGGGINDAVSMSPSNWNAGNSIDGGTYGVVYLNSYNSDSAALYDLTTNTLSHIRELQGYGANLTVQINSAVAGGVAGFYGFATNAKLVTSDAALDLSHSKVSGFTVTSDNVAGTNFTVGDINTALKVVGGLGTDTITAQGFTLTADERSTIFATASVERIVDASGTYTVNNAPTITSNGGGDAAAVFIAENTTAVTTVAATDPDVGQTPSYSIIGGADAGKFTIGSTTGALSFVTAPNYEAPTDAGGDNVYDVMVQVSDGHGGIDTQAIAVTVNDVFENDAPSTSGNFSLTAGADAVVGGAVDDTVYATAATLNSGDSLTGGSGTDVLALVGGGFFQVDQLASFTGFERIRFDNATNYSASLTLGSQPIEVDATGFLNIQVNSPSNWNGNNIINGNASGSWNTTSLNFTNSLVWDDTGIPQQLPIIYDLTSNTLSHVNISVGGNEITVLINNADTAGIQSFSGWGLNDKLATAGSTLDLSHTTVAGLAVTSTNALGTAFTVGDLGTAFQIAGGSGQDTIIATGFTFSAEQRNAIFATASIEKIVDQTGTYTGPPPSPGVVGLTTGDDTIVTPFSGSTVYATAATLNSGDSLTGGSGTDVLALVGGGFFQVDQLASFTGFERIRFDNATNYSASLTLGSQPIEVDATGFLNIQVNSPSNWNGNNIINGNASGSWNTTSLNFTNSLVWDDTGIPQQLPIIYDLTSNTLSHVNISVGGNEITVLINNADTAGIQSFSGWGLNDKLATAGSTLDLSHTTVAGLAVTSTNALGTAFTVGDLGTAFQIAGGSGQDTIIATGFTFSAEQRNAIFATASIEKIVDQTGTYTGPPPSPGVVGLTTGDDTIVTPFSGSTVYATAATLNSGDSLTGGSGTDVLALVGGGFFQVDQLASFTGFERIRFDNATNYSASLTLGSQPIEVDATGFLNIQVNSPSNWNGNNIINGNASGSWNTTSLNFTNSLVWDDTGIPQQLPIIYDLTSNTLSHVNISVGGNEITVLINNADTAGIQSFSGWGLNDKLATAGSTLDLSHTTVAGLAVTSTNALGTAFTVGDLGTAFQIAGGSGQDTIIATGFTFSAEQRNAIFATASIEKIVDQTGTYTGPPPSPGVVGLTTGDDTIVTPFSGSTVYATAATLNSGDSLTGGSGTDVLALVGGGFFQVDQLASFTGFERIRFDNATNYSASLTLGSQPIEVDATGFLNIQVNSPSNWNGNNIINGNASGSWNTTSLNFTNSLVWDDTGIPQQLPIIYDLTSNTLSHVNISVGGNEITVLINNADTAGIQSFSGWGLNDKLATAGSTLDLSHTTVAGLAVTSTNALGTAFTVGDLGTAFQIAGGSGQDTIIATGFTFSAEQRNSIFATASVEKIVDSSGTYTVDNAWPTITSNGGGDATISIVENTTAVTTVTATDPDIGQNRSYSIIGGADASKFTIGSSTGALSFVTAPNFELPTDAGGNNIYDVIVQASDGHGGIDVQAIAVSVQNVAGVTVNGTAGNDVIDKTHTVAGQPFPTAEGDILNGGAGNDTLNGGAGADRLDGGAGIDTASYSAATEGVTVDLTLTGPQVSTGEAAGDVLISIENLIGGAGNDTLTGNSGNNVLEGGAGADHLDGGAGTDTASYATSGSGIDVSLMTGLGSVGDAAGDTLANIENLTGSNFDDVLEGNSGNNVLAGGTNGLGGDTASYANAMAAVTVSLATTLAQNTLGAGNDTLLGFENLTGSAFSDKLTGSSLANVLVGGAGNDVINGGAGNDTLQGGADDDTLIGGAGSDALDGGAGNDTASYATSTVAVTVDLNAGTGLGGDAQGDTLTNIENLIGSAFNDTLTGDGNDNVLTGGAGNDTLAGGLNGAGGDTASYATATAGVTVSLLLQGGAQNTVGAGVDTLSGIENLIGSAFNDTLTGDGNNNVLTGGAGNDMLLGGIGNDTLDGGAGVADSAAYATAGSGVTVSLAIAGPQDTVGAGVDTLIGIERLIGSSGNDTLTGSGLANRIDGGAGDDTIDGGAGNDILIGGANTAGGDTVSYASSASAVTVSLTIQDGVTAQNTIGAGTDTLSGFENVTGSDFNDTLTGDGAGNHLIGNDGNDTLNGGAGADQMQGGLGNDIYVVDNAGDVVDETGGDGTDRVQSSVSFDLSGTKAIGDVENLTLTGIAAINGTGNALDNIIIGNIAANLLIGNGGNDTLDGGAGADTMRGGLGNDTYVVDSASDVVIEVAGEGTDTVRSLVSYALAAEIENLTLTGTAAINGTGNALDNIIIGNSAANVIAGLGGADTLDGGGGIDTASYAASLTGVEVSLALGIGFDGDAEGDKLVNFENLTGSAFDDVLEGNSGNNTLVGGAGNDTLDGGAGNDTLNGGAGFDMVSYANATAGVTVNLALVATAQNTIGAGTDTLSGFENVTGSDFNDTLTGDGAGNHLIGNDGNDTLNGGAGADQMQGGLGNDIYVVDNAGDVVDETGGDGTDRVQSSVSFDLSGTKAIGDVENLTLTGIAAINGTGNALDNIIIGNIAANLLIGNGGNDTLDGGAGNDTLTGGLGDDILIGGAGADTLNGSDGSDTASYATSATGVTVNLNLATAQVGTGDALGDVLSNIDNITGSAFADTLIGDGNANVLTGGLGTDKLIGGAGSDTFVFNKSVEGKDIITDFTTGSDLISISRSGFGIAAGVALGTGDANDFANHYFVSATAVPAATEAGHGQFLFNQTTGQLFWDDDGTGSHAATAVATLTNVHALGAQDFLLV